MRNHDRLESGDGFADIIFRKKRDPRVNVIIELKKSSSERIWKEMHIWQWNRSSRRTTDTDSKVEPPYMG